MMKNAETITYEFSSKHISDPTFKDVRRKMEGHRAEFLRKMKDDCTSRSIVMVIQQPISTLHEYNLFSSRGCPPSIPDTSDQSQLGSILSRADLRINHSFQLYSAPTESKEGCNDSLSLDGQILRGDMEISSWNATKVKEWMNDHKINWENTENLNGQDLCFLKRLRNEAPEFFYKMASEKWRITSVSALRKLTNSLESL
ncbi:unnamed protein product [Dibothriocephalus latus]|uniref:Uncharacterized protein n=1 Tax=Dibothriocephalus latus TaxID=60516 RepID=A0A3P6T631_DIBLA|nr:unnamed protein product [Dibothriocephalus latus]